MSEIPVARDVRWGILSTGLICSDFANALSKVSGASLAGVAASSPEKARRFAKTHNVKTVFMSLEDMIADSAIDIIYVGSVNTMHKEHVLKCLGAGKSVLCEKPLALSVADARDMVEMARKNGCFFMEGAWTRFFPAVAKLRELICSGAIGDVTTMFSNLGTVITREASPRIYDPALGGGVTHDLGCYTFSFACLVFSSDPLAVVPTGTLDAATGVDLNVGVSLDYGDGRLAHTTYTCLAHGPQETVVCGTKGMLKLQRPSHAPTILSCHKFEGRSEFEPETFEFPLPDFPPEITWNYPRSQGLVYEAMHVQDCIRQKLQESPLYMWEDMLRVAYIGDQVRAGLGTTYPRGIPASLAVEPKSADMDTDSSCTAS